MIGELLQQARNLKASDLHLIAGACPMVRVDGDLKPMTADVLTLADTAQCAEEMGIFDLQGEKDLAYEFGGQRYRVNAYLKQDTIALAVRIIPDGVPSIDSLCLPPIVSKFGEISQGLVIITGPTGSGKSTTLAALIDRINALKHVHIVTLEDPIEYRHVNRRALVNQREVGSDTGSFASGLRAALRQDPDVIMVGELRDAETMEIALSAAETGHLVLATMHTNDATGAISRILDTCGDNNNLVRNQLAGCLQGIVAQQLVPGAHGGRVAACEILVATTALRNLIRENKIFQIPSFIQTGAQYGMQNMDVAILKLRRDGFIK
ncbi:MAG: PilT/PilU family type 4a pilus ATPase [Acidaminococcaceae bacterium]|nr:PilT/PilU family type 4a pilus ATPase [Acidaminococcaceae bacterium]